MNGDMPEGVEGWRAFHEHPLTAATTAMLNINGGESNEEQVSGIGLLCDYYPQDNNNNSINSNNKTIQLSTQPSTEQNWSATSRIAASTITTVASGEPKVKIVPMDTSKLATAIQCSSPQQTPTSVVLNEQMSVYLMNQANMKESDAPRPIILNCKSIEPSEMSEQNSAQNINSLVNSENNSVNLPNGDVNGHHPTSAIVSIIKQEPIDESTNSSICEQSSILAAELKGNRLAKSPVMDSVVIQHTPGTPGTPGTPVMIESTPTALSPTEIVSQSPQPPSYPNQVFATLQQAQVYEPVTVSGAQFGILPTVVVQQPSQSPQVYGTQAISNSQAAPTVYSLTTTDYYKQYYDIEQNGNVTTQTSQSAEPYQVRQQMYQTTNNGQEMFIRQNGTTYKNGINSATMGLTVDLPSPDSGIGETAVTPRDNNTSVSQMHLFDYSDIANPQAHSILTSAETTLGRQSNRRSWHEYGRGSESDKIQIPKLFSDFGYKYHLESPISTSQRREDDRITYINKGQFYGITLEYVPDPEKQVCSQTVKSMIMLVFREEKSHEDEIKAWQFWHGRQHSVKQRILDADTKNSSGIVGCIDEITHNAITFYWNPMEGPGKVNVAVQCLSTDFSNQKGVKGLPLHLQIDTFEDVNLVHRAYCQIKVFCDKGAERKTRDEERRAAKRKLTATGRKKMDEMYHAVCERSEFYTMSDISKPPVLFSPSEDIEKISGMELNFYNQPSQQSEEISLDTTPTPTPTRVSTDAKETSDLNSPEASIFTSPSPKRLKGVPSTNERVMLYVRQDNEETFNALHLVPPNMFGLCNANDGEDGRRHYQAL